MSAKTISKQKVDDAVEDLKASELNSKAAQKDLWWMFAFRGLLLALFGLLAVAWPGITLRVLALLFALFLLIGGLVNIVSGVRSLAGNRAWFLRLALGLLEVGIGVYLLSSEVVTKVSVFVIYLGLMFLIEGIIELVEAFAGKRDSGHRVLLGVAGFLGIVAGLILIRYPITAGITFTWVIGLYGIIAGAIGFIYGLSLRSSK